MDNGYHATLSLQLAAAADNNIAASQADLAGAALLINGVLAAGGVATLDVPRHVIITSSGDDSGITFTVRGTARNGAVLSKTVAGTNGGIAEVAANFATVTSVTPSGPVAANVKVGTNASAATKAFIVDKWVSNGAISVDLTMGGGNTNGIEVSYEDLAPGYEMDTYEPKWVTPVVTNNVIQGPISMIRLKQTAGTALSTLTVITTFKAGRV